MDSTLFSLNLHILKENKCLADPVAVWHIGYVQYGKFYPIVDNFLAEHS